VKIKESRSRLPLDLLAAACGGSAHRGQPLSPERSLSRLHVLFFSGTGKDKIAYRTHSRWASRARATSVTKDSTTWTGRPAPSSSPRVMVACKLGRIACEAVDPRETKWPTTSTGADWPPANGDVVMVIVRVTLLSHVLDVLDTACRFHASKR
jgi:hypothetical protein